MKMIMEILLCFSSKHRRKCIREMKDNRPLPLKKLDENLGFLNHGLTKSLYFELPCTHGRQLILTLSEGTAD
jgi:hypothetical protein